MSTLKIISWTKDIKTVSLVESIKEYSTGSLIQAKENVDRLIDGESIELHFDNDERKEEFRDIAGDLGVILG